MFTLVKSILLKPLAYPEPDRLVRITQNSPYESVNHPSFALAPTEFLPWHQEIRSFESLTLLRGATVNLTGVGAPEVLGAAPSDEADLCAWTKQHVVLSFGQ